MGAILIDFESTGLDTRVARIIEIGAMVVDDDWNPTGEQISQLVWSQEHPELTDEVQGITGLTQDLLTKNGIPLNMAFQQLGNLITDKVKYAVAFNRAYDETLYKEELSRTNLNTKGLSLLYSMPWLCAMIDIESNYKFKSWKLSHLALEYKVPVDPNKLHRAINDVDLMRQMLAATKTTAAEMHAYQQIPWVYVAARTSKPWEDAGKSTDLAKARGYNWQTAKGDMTGKFFEKTWIKRIKEKDFDKEQREAQFQVRIIKETL